MKLSINKHKHFKIIYVRLILLIVLAALSIVVIAFIQNTQLSRFIGEKTHLAETINISGRQRMLSQNISKNAILISKSDESTLQVRKQKIDSLLQIFKLSHLQLTQKSNTLFSNENHSLDSLFQSIDPSYKRFVQLLGQLISEPNVDQEVLDEIVLMGDVFLPGMDQITNEYERLSEIVLIKINDNVAKANLSIAIGVVIAAIIVLIIMLQIIKGYSKKLTEQSSDLVDANDQLERFFQNSSDLVYGLDENSKYLYVNKTVEKIVGYSAEELKNKSCWEFVPEEYLEETKAYYLGVIKRKEKSAYYEFPILDKDGTLVWLGQSVDYLYEGDKAVRAYTIAKDITNIKRDDSKREKHRDGLHLLNELGAKNSDNYLELLSEGLTLCTDFLDLDLGIVSNVQGETYTIVDFVPEGAGLERGQTFELGGTYCDITLKAERTISIDEMSTSEYKAHPCYGNFNLESYIGASYSVNGEVRGTVNFTSQAAHERPFTEYDVDFVTLVARWVGTIIENHESRKAQEEEQGILEAFVSAAPAAIAMFDTEMNYLASSQKWSTEYKLDRNLKGRSQYDVLPAAKERKEIHQRALKGEVIGKEEERFEMEDGRVIWVKWETRPWYNSKKEIGGVITYTDDITTFKLQKEELKKAKEEAEVSSRIKAQFLSTMSHEIRTPLNAIIGTTNLLELEHPELAGNDRMKLLKFGSSNLLSLINDVLDFQKIESGNLDIDKTDFNLKELSSNIIETWVGVGSERNISLNLNYDDLLPSFYKGDAVRLGQVINNLISNSLKFTEEGMVSLKISSAEKGRVQFEIKDTGIGIAEDKLASIFESFKQIPTEQTAKRGGTGLGLSISKKLVSLMGGELTATSKIGVGSIFKFTIDLEKSESQKEQKVSSLEMKKMDLKALLAEDNTANQAIATSFLNRWGIKVEIANNGEEAVEKIVDQSYDFVLMDIRMPIMGGYEAAKRIRKMEDEYFTKIPIIALTASTLLNTDGSIDECGFNAFVSKPFNPKDLFEQISLVTSLEKKIPDDKNDLGSFKFLSQFYGDDIDQIHKIVDTSIDSIYESMDIIEKGSQKKDKEMVYDGLHVLRPNLAYVDLGHIADQIPSVDAADVWERIPVLLSHIKKELSMIRSGLSKANKSAS